MGNCRVSMLQELVDTLGINIGTVETIICECLGLQKVSARWVPKMLSAEQKKVYLQVYTTLLNYCSDKECHFSVE